MTYFFDLFKPIHANTIGVFAKLFSATFAIMLLVHFNQQLRYFKSQPTRVQIKPEKLFDIYEIPPLNVLLFKVLGWVMIGSLLAIVVGFLPRFFIFITLVCYIPYFNAIQSLEYIVRKSNLLPFVLLVLLVSPSLNTPLSISVPNWDVILIKIGMTQMYLSAGIQKLKYGGLKWGNGPSLQAHLAENYLLRGNKWVLLLAKQRVLCQVLSVWTLFFELTFGLILFYPSLTVFYVLNSFCFHLGIGLTMRINYLIYLSPVYMIFWKDFSFLF